MRESRRRGGEGCVPWYDNFSLSQPHPTPPHREYHGDILNFYSQPSDGMKMSPTEVFEENWEGKKQWNTNLCEKWVTEKASSNQMRTGMLLRRQTSDTVTI